MKVFEDVVDLSRCFHVDSKPESFLGHKSSSIPIIPFTGNEDDMELARLSNYLTKLHKEDHAQSVNESTFKLEEISNADSVKTALKLVFNQK